MIKIDKTECAIEKRKRKSGKRNPNWEKKSKRSEKVHSSIKRSKDSMLQYTKKNDLNLEVNTAILEPFWISDLRKLNVSGPWIQNKNFLPFVPQ